MTVSAKVDRGLGTQYEHLPEEPGSGTRDKPLQEQIFYAKYRLLLNSK